MEEIEKDAEFTTEATMGIICVFWCFDSIKNGRWEGESENMNYVHLYPISFPTSGA